MILHLTPGLTPIEVHIHNEYGLAETLTVAPRAGAPALAAPLASSPAPGRAFRPSFLAMPVVAVLFGFIGYQAGSRAGATGQEIARAVALRRSSAMPTLDAQPQLAMPPMRSGALQPESATDPAQAAMPVEVARALAQQPSVAPSRNVPSPTITLPQPAAPAGSNPFGLE